MYKTTKILVNLMGTLVFGDDVLGLLPLLLFLWSALMLTAQSVLLYKVLPLIRKMYENSEVATKIFKKPDDEKN